MSGQIFRFTQGPKILVDFGNRILSEVEASTPVGSTSIAANRSPGGTLLRALASSLSSYAWTWKAYNTSTGATGQVQINGGDGFVATLNGRVANVNGQPNDTPSGSPAKYPQLAVTGNGVIYGYAVPATPGNAGSLSPTSGTLDVYYAGSLPSLDTAVPAAYFPFLIATISNYATDGSGNVSFSLNNAFDYGPTNLIYCGAAIQIY